MLVAGDLRIITPKDRFKAPFTVVEKVTKFESGDLQEISQIRPEILVRGKICEFETEYVVLKRFDEYVIQQYRQPSFALERDF